MTRFHAWAYRLLRGPWLRLLTLLSVVRCHLRSVRLFHAARGAPAPGEPDAGGPAYPLTLPALPPPAASPLYQHSLHPHLPRNAVAAHRQAQAQQRGVAGFNRRVAVWLTTHVGSMLCAYLFAGIGVGSLVGVFTNNVFLAALFGSVSSYFLQLVLLPIISVGTNVLNEHQEAQSEQMFRDVVRLLHEQAETAQHLAAQDAELLKQTGYLLQLVQTVAQQAPPPAGSASAPTPSSSPSSRAAARASKPKATAH